jgi:glycosyltransferase involved in cell wall biosynthesis
MSRRINIIARDNGVGLTRDLQLLADALRAGGCDVTVTGIRRGKVTKWLRPWARRGEWMLRRLFRGRRASTHDINVMLEHVWPDDAPFARTNVLIPNPEWLLPRDRQRLHRIDHVLAKTRHAEVLFQGLGPAVHYVGFTSVDRMLPEVPRVAGFFHLAGRSRSKGTERLLALWRRHPEWPRLTVVQSPHNARPGEPVPNIDHQVGYMDDATLQALQNSHWFHLCPSETEGYGHYLTEAMSVGAVVITLDAPPMNELVQAGCGILVPPSADTGRQHLATTYFFDDDAMAAAVEKALAMDEETLRKMGECARAQFLANEASFAPRLLRVIDGL